MAFDKTYWDHFSEMSEEEKKVVENLGSCTAWDLYQEYGISKLKVSRAIKNGKLNAYMKSTDGKNLLIKWYIIKDDALKEFIDKNKVSPKEE